jgi:hypothetical protein
MHGIGAWVTLRSGLGTLEKSLLLLVGLELGKTRITPIVIAGDRETPRAELSIYKMLKCGPGSSVGIANG